jgi:multidrug efflux pump subunit AcrA (membrane-fusion protein)
VSIHNSAWQMHRESRFGTDGLRVVFAWAALLIVSVTTGRPGGPLVCGIAGGTEPGTGQVPESLVIEAAYLKYVSDLDIPAPVDGIILEMSAVEGSWFEAGAPIIQLDDRLARAELEIARQELKAATEKAEDESEVAFARKTLDFRRQTYAMISELRRKGSASSNEEYERRLELERAELAVPVAELTQRRDQAAAKVAAATVQKAELEMELRRIPAPFAGVIAQQYKQPRDWVRAGEPILRIVSLDKLRVRGAFTPSASISSQDIEGAPARVMVGTPGSPRYLELNNCRVGFVSPVQSAGDSYDFWIEIDNPRTPPGGWALREGMVARVEIYPQL